MSFAKSEGRAAGSVILSARMNADSTRLLYLAMSWGEGVIVPSVDLICLAKASLVSLTAKKASSAGDDCQTGPAL